MTGSLLRAWQVDMSDKTTVSGILLLRRYIRSLISESGEAENSIPSETLDVRIGSRLGRLMEFPGVGIRIAEDEDGGIRISYAKIHRKGDEESYRSPRRTATSPWGYIVINDVHDAGPCLSDELGDPWVLEIVEASTGWGPLLYDIALEYASSSGGGLMPDRKTVSDFAISVWDKYASRGDVEKHQLDISHDPDLADEREMAVKQRTPEIESDDCVQSRALETAGEEGWERSPLSKVYRKAGTPVMDALNSAGLLWNDT